MGPARLILLAGCALYLLLFLWAYSELISPQYAYYGFQWNPSDGGALLAACLLALTPALWLPIGLRRPSQVVYWILYLLVIVPSCVVPVVAMDNDASELLFLALFLVLAFALLGMIYHLPLARFSSAGSISRLSPRTYWLFVGALGALFLAHIFSVYGFNLRFVSLLEVYDVRLEYTAAATGSLIGYTVSWLAFSISPLLTMYGLVRRRMLFLVAGLLLFLLVYGLAAYKSVLFMPVLIVGTYFAQRGRARFGLLVIAGGIGLILATALAGAILSNVAIPFLVVGRTIAMPGLLTGYFYDFFSFNPKAMLGYSVFQSFVQYPYSMVPSYLIGAEYFSNANAQANVHLWADAYANFGYGGVIVFTVLLAGILWLFDSLTRPSTFAIMCGVLSVHAFNLANGALLTSVLTQGIGLTLLLIMLMPAPDIDTAPRRVRLRC